MNWIDRTKKEFFAEKPVHFTDYEHCDECAEHDETLLSSTIDDIGLNELGNPGWDPICFCSDDGKRYYMPAFIRLSIESVDDHFYFTQFLFHLALNVEGHNLLASCTSGQRKLVSDFLAHMIEKYPEQIEKNHETESALRIHRLWLESIE